MQISGISQSTQLRCTVQTTGHLLAHFGCPFSFLCSVSGKSSIRILFTQLEKLIQCSPSAYRVLICPHFQQNVVGLVQMVVAWAIPDVPRKLSDRIKREEYLTREIIIDHELQRAAVAREREREESPNLTKNFGNIFRLRKVNGENVVANSEL